MVLLNLGCFLKQVEIGQHVWWHISQGGDVGNMIYPFPADDRDGDLSSSSRTELAGTHGQCGRGSYCPNQLISAFLPILTGLIYCNKNFLVFIAVFIILDQVHCTSHFVVANIYMLKYKFI